MAYTSLQAMRGMIAREQEFTGSNTRAERFDEGDYVDTGRLPSEWASELRRTGARYVVFSYATPIAWVTPEGEIVVPSVKYSVSTSKVQGYVASGFRSHVNGTEIRTALAEVSA